MIEEKDGFFCLHGDSFCYLLCLENGELSLIHFGRDLPIEDGAALKLDRSVLPGRATLSPDGRTGAVTTSEFPLGRYGDKLSPCLQAEKGGKSSFDFLVRSHRINELAEPMDGYPTPKWASELVFELADEAMGVEVELHYLLFKTAVGRYMRIVNHGEPLTVRKALCSITFPFVDFSGRFLSASWADEARPSDVRFNCGCWSMDSSLGASCEAFNPFFYLRRENGECYGFNLVYSGNHFAAVEAGKHGFTRVMNGISPTAFAKTVSDGEAFTTPLSVLTYGEDLDCLSHANSDFVNGCIIPEAFANKVKPITYNNWEATYFKFTRQKIYALARKAKKLGIELFVLDDGWFGSRDDDTKSLGDWKPNLKKLPGGPRKVSDYVHRLGMKFGLWFEPEMVNPDSDLYRAHPDWALSDGVHENSLGRNQLTLDLTKPEVQDFIVDTIVSAIKDYRLDYVKWDYNRSMDGFPRLEGNYCHEYVMSLYKVLSRIKQRCPDTLFENCASGGSRNDLGMYSFFPYGWLSDDTDSYERAKMQRELSVGYPFSVFSNHVSAKTSHQMFRYSSLGTKFDVAMLGCLGYELDLSALRKLDEREIASQISFYKAHRELAQLGRRYDVSGDGFIAVESQLGDKALVSFQAKEATPNFHYDFLHVKGLRKEGRYILKNRKESFDLRRFGSMVNYVSPVRIKEDGALINLISRHYEFPSEETSLLCSGSALDAGVPLPPAYCGSGISKSSRIMFDFSARAYSIEPCSEGESKAKSKE